MAEGEAWENELRRVLAGQASQARSPSSDLATTVVTRARRSAYRRSAGRLVAVVGATVLATGVMLQDWQPAPEPEFGAVTGLVGDRIIEQQQRETESVQMAADDRLAVELSVQLLGEGSAGGTVLATAQGELIDLRRIRQVRSAQQVGSGWAVVSGQPGTLRLWWVTYDHPPVSLLTGLDAVVVDGDRVAWQRLGVLAAARMVAGELVDRVTTTGLAEAEQPVGMLDESVLLKRFDIASGSSWDSWHPGLGHYRPTWTDKVRRVYGMLPDGGGAVGLVAARSGAGPLCLARLDVHRQFDVIETWCPSVELAPAGPAAISPDRRLLLATTAAGEVVLVRLDQLFALAQDAVTRLSDVPLPADTPVWLGSDRVLWTAGDRLALLWPDRLGGQDAVEVVPLTGNAPVAVGFS